MAKRKEMLPPISMSDEDFASLTLLAQRQRTTITQLTRLAIAKMLAEHGLDPLTQQKQ